MATGLASWSQTAANNATADSNVNWAEGMAPSAVNDSARAMMASLAKWRDDNAGTLTTGGTSTAYTLTTNQGFASLSAMNGQSLRVKIHTTNGSNPTLNVDGLGAKTIVSVTGTAAGFGMLLTSSIYDIVFDNSNNYWIVVGLGFVPLGIVSGTRMLFQQTSAPTGWTKDTTHDDKALRVVSGSASSGGSTAFSSVFAARTIAQANLPNVNFSVSASGSVAVDVKGANGGASGNSTVCFTRATTDTVSGTNPATGTASVTGTAASGGSGTALDFAVKYLDCIAASKD